MTAQITFDQLVLALERYQENRRPYCDGGMTPAEAAECVMDYLTTRGPEPIQVKTPDQLAVMAAADRSLHKKIGESMGLSGNILHIPER